MSELALRIQALLFWKGDAFTKDDLKKALAVPVSDIDAALDELQAHTAASGIRLIRNGDEVALATAPEAAEMIDHMRKEELSRDLGKAGAETLATILYRGPSTRSEIEYVRGVNCSAILRSLMIRGLIDRVPSETRKGSFEYRPSTELLAHLGVASVDTLPEYASAHIELTKWEAEKASAEEIINDE